MSKTPPWNVDTDAYLADTSSLRGATAHGAYLLIMMAMWRSAEGILPDDDETLARCAHLTLDKWRRVAPMIRPLLQTITSGITQKRVRRDKLAAKRSAPSESQNPSQNPGSTSKPLESKERISEEGAGPQTALSLNLPPTESETLRKEVKREAGIPLPDDWEIGDKSRLYVTTVLKFSNAEADAGAARMRRWALANSHRKEGRKAGRRGWDLTFENWMERDAHRRLQNGGGNEAAKQRGPGHPGGGQQSFATRALARARSPGDEGSGGASGSV